ncbi:hypothetical protein BDV97DRAFT_288731 [Delphinella strobiligena]|nr:hypothetical protein BDV97DRAFT_288731 [Delphinella strobiligena]
MTSSFSQWNDNSTRLPLFFPQSKPHDPSRSEPYRDWKLQVETESPHLNSRTRKRYRDNRPDEEQVHGMSIASTMTKLFDAQREHPDAAPILSQSIPVRQQQVSQKSTLHSFWQLPKHSTVMTPHAESMHVLPGRSHSLGLVCDDCDRTLISPDAMDIDEAMFEEETACRACGKHVCDTCAVAGNQRKCLECATY